MSIYKPPCGIQLCNIVVDHEHVNSITYTPANFAIALLWFRFECMCLYYSVTLLTNQWIEKGIKEN